MRATGGWVALCADTAASIDRVEITVRRSKTDQHADGYKRLIHRSGHPHVCLVSALVAHLLASSTLPSHWPVAACDRSTRGSLLRSQRVVCRNDIAQALKQAGIALGEDPSQYASHSLRIGGATALHALGVPDAWIMWLGNWKSPAYLLYCRSTTAVPRYLASLMVYKGAKVFEDRMALPLLQLRQCRPRRAEGTRRSRRR